MEALIVNQNHDMRDVLIDGSLLAEIEGHSQGRGLWGCGKPGVVFGRRADQG